MIVTKDSHADHSLTPAHLAFLVEEFGAVEEFMLKTITLPRELPSLPCDLHGPLVGDASVLDSECVMARRGTRNGLSRQCARSPRLTRLMTVIIGPHEGEVILYTAFGGPAAPREPFDLPHGSPAHAESLAFWSEHALSRLKVEATRP